MSNLHYHFDRLSPTEQTLVNDLIHTLMREARKVGYPLAGDDRIERLVDALSRCVIESR